MAKVLAVCISEKKGEIKHPVEKAELKIDHGIVGDAHALLNIQTKATNKKMVRGSVLTDMRSAKNGKVNIWVLVRHVAEERSRRNV